SPICKVDGRTIARVPGLAGRLGRSRLFLGLVQDELGNGAFVAERVWNGDIVARARKTLPESIQDPLLAGIARDEMKDVDSAVLADAVHSPDALFQPHRVPGQLQIDHDPALLVKIQPLAGGVGCEQDSPAPA